LSSAKNLRLVAFLIWLTIFPFDIFELLYWDLLPRIRSQIDDFK
jgi:hypothetical protein